MSNDGVPENIPTSSKEFFGLNSPRPLEILVYLNKLIFYAFRYKFCLLKVLLPTGISNNYTW